MGLGLGFAKLASGSHRYCRFAAGRKKYHRPTILISLSEEPGKGSGRSIEGFDLYKALKALGHLFERFGGTQRWQQGSPYAGS